MSSLPDYYFVNPFLVDRETEAKAKRLARFKDDLSRQNARDDSSIPQKGPSTRMSQYQSVVDRPKFSAEDIVDSSDDFSDGNLLSDYQGSESSGVIIGSCPDMCPGMLSNFSSYLTHLLKVM